VKKCAAEFIGTFALVFAGTGAIVVNEVSHGAITHVGVALTFGLIVLVMITPSATSPVRTLIRRSQLGSGCHADCRGATCCHISPANAQARSLRAA